MRQRLKVKHPKYPRTPWVSSADGLMQEVEERRARVELDDEGGGEDDKARGPSPGASSAASARELGNPAERFFSEWIDQCQGHRLTVCKRCGPKVTNFVSKMFDFASDFTSSGDQKRSCGSSSTTGTVGARLPSAIMPERRTSAAWMISGGTIPCTEPSC